MSRRGAFPTIDPANTLSTATLHTPFPSHARHSPHLPSTNALLNSFTRLQVLVVSAANLTTFVDIIPTFTAMFAVSTAAFNALNKLQAAPRPPPTM